MFCLGVLSLALPALASADSGAATLRAPAKKVSSAGMRRRGLDQSPHVNGRSRLDRPTARRIKTADVEAPKAPVFVNKRGLLTRAGEFHLAEQMEIADVDLWTAILVHPGTREEVMALIAPALVPEKASTNRKQGMSKEDFQRAKQAAQERENLAAEKASAAADAFRASFGKSTLSKAARAFATELRARDLDQELVRDVVLAHLKGKKTKNADLSRHLQLLEQKVAATKAPRTEFVDRNQRLVHKIALKYTPPNGQDHDDLVSPGNLGLLKAVNRFDRHRGFKFSTFGSSWVKQGIRRAIADATRDNRVGVSVRAKKAIDPHEDPKTGKRGFDPAGREIAPDDLLASAESIQAIRDALPKLDERHRLVLELRFGFQGEAMTLKEVGEQLGVTRERIRQIEAKALERLAFVLDRQKVPTAPEAALSAEE